MPSTATAFRLPGVYFLPPPRVLPLGLPPLDVAAFVGFTERGPLHLPVPVDDMNMYHGIFGGDMAIAREVSSKADLVPSSPPADQVFIHQQDGRMIYVNLPQSVAAFFANGGRRCYVVRVAGKNATASRFRVPGIVALGPGGSARLASILASSPGRWSDRLRLATRLQVTPLPKTKFTLQDIHHLLWETGSAPQAVQEGDLLRLTLDNEQQWLFPVTRMQRQPEVKQKVLLAAQDSWQCVVSAPASPPLTIERVFRLTFEGAEIVHLSGVAEGTGRGIQLILIGTDTDRVRRGDVLLMDFSDGFTYVAAVNELSHKIPVDSPPTQVLRAQVDALLRFNPSTGPSVLMGGSPPASLLSVERLRLDLVVHDGDRRRMRLSEMAFNAPHPRFWGEVALLESSTLRRRASFDGTSQSRTLQGFTTMPTQDSVFNSDITLATRVARLYRELQADRRIEPTQDGGVDPIPLGGLLAPLEGDAQETYLPLGMRVTDSDLVSPEPGNVGDDDLDAYTASLFLDQYLARTSQNSSTASASSLMAAAFDRYYVQDRRLHGLHSLMFVDEVALVSIADANHRGWAPAKAIETSVAAPDTNPPPVPADTFLDCHAPPTVLAVTPASGPTTGGTEVTVTGTGFVLGEATSIRFAGDLGLDIHVLSPTRLCCTTPALGLSGPVTVEVTTVNGSGAKANAYTYRQRPTEPLLPEMDPVDEFELDNSPLLPLHQALINFCQGRADVVGILTLPAHFEKRQCIEWQERLRERLDLPRRGSVFTDVREVADLSYVAVYHPWLLIADATAREGLRAVSPDGAVCGVIAARERARQVWVAPANMAVQGTLGLTPVLTKEDWPDLFAAQFNLIRDEVQGLRVMSAHTLSDEHTLLQLSVRRLLILLRKAAVERGMDHVFESNQERTRDAIRLSLENLLRFMFERGAFAGVTQPAAFRVVMDSSVNPPESIDQGRLIAQIAIAPSQPLEFITVQLIRTGEGLLQATEV
jgi:hypothetical protein